MVMVRDSPPPKKKERGSAKRAGISYDVRAKQKEKVAVESRTSGPLFMHCPIPSFFPSPSPKVYKGLCNCLLLFPPESLSPLSLLFLFFSLFRNSIPALSRASVRIRVSARVPNRGFNMFSTCAKEDQNVNEIARNPPS